MKNYLGVLLIILGALVLVASYIMEWVDYNWVQFGALAIIIAGLIVHIILQKKS